MRGFPPRAVRLQHGPPAKVDAGAARPTEHRVQVRIGHGVGPEQVFIAPERSGHEVEALREQPSRGVLGGVRSRRAHEQRSEDLVDLGADEAESFLQPAALEPAVGRREPRG